MNCLLFVSFGQVLLSLKLERETVEKTVVCVFVKMKIETLALFEKSAKHEMKTLTFSFSLFYISIFNFDLSY